MHRKTRKRASVAKIIWIDAVFVAALISGLALAVWYHAQSPQQEIAVVIPNQPAPTCSPDVIPEITEVPPQPKVLYDPYPEQGERIGTITLESLDLSWPIFEGTDEAQLSKGVGHYLGSVLPGLNDNSILSGHRSTVFGRLGELKKGDRILVETKVGIFVYEITKFKVVDRDDQSVIQPTDDATLTLTTCYPFGNVANTTEAYIVTAKLISSDIKSPEAE